MRARTRGLYVRVHTAPRDAVWSGAATVVPRVEDTLGLLKKATRHRARRSLVYRFTFPHRLPLSLSLSFSLTTSLFRLSLSRSVESQHSPRVSHDRRLEKRNLLGLVCCCTREREV